MKNLVRLAMASAILAAMPASAHEVGILIDKQFGKSSAFTVPYLNAWSYNAQKPNGYGIRGAYTVLDLKVAELGFTGTYHPKTESDLKVSVPFAGVNDLKVGKLGMEYWSLGVQADWKFLVNLHLGMDVRRETISTDIAAGTQLVSPSVLPPPLPPEMNVAALSLPGLPGGLTHPADKGDTTITRLWINAGVGFSIPLPVVSPFVRLEAAYAMKSYDAPATLTLDNFKRDDIRRSLAGNYQIALYGGVRF